MQNDPVWDAQASLKAFLLLLRHLNMTCFERGFSTDKGGHPLAPSIIEMNWIK